jgi:hypothetical protein
MPQTGSFFNADCGTVLIDALIDSFPTLCDSTPTVVVYLNCGRNSPEMTQMEVTYHYANPLSESEMRAMDNVREVYGIRRLRLDEKERIVRVEYDASRFKEPVVANLLRGAGFDLKDRLVLA